MAGSNASVTFADAIKVQRLDSHSYKVHLSAAYSIGAVPNGGYTASVMLAAAKQHLSAYGQLDPLTAHFEYPTRSAAGPAVVIIEDIKISKNGGLSTLQLNLYQDGLIPEAPWITSSVSRRVVLGLSTHLDLRKASGLSMPVGFEQTPAGQLPEQPDLEDLKAKGRNELWEEHKLPGSASRFMRSLLNWKFYVPRKGPLSPGVLDMWVRLSSGERITQDTLPYLIDSFPFNVHLYLATPEVRQMFMEPMKENGTGEKEGEKRDSKGNEGSQGDGMRSALWFPTVVMNLEAKMPLPEEGVEWMAVRLVSKQIKDGRFDIELTVRDLEGEIVALSNHVAMIVDVGRNTAKRGPRAKASL